MISLFSITRIVKYGAVAYAIIVVLLGAVLAQFNDGSWSTWADIRIAVAGAAGLEGVLLVLVYFGWRRLWRWFPILNRWLYPDISGVWNMTIDWQGQGNQGTVDAKATIRLNFTRISMEVRSPGSDSQTLMAQPKKDPESGRPLLYYVYAVIPKAIGTNARPTYYGAAMLKFWESEGGELSGNYWTNEQRRGHFRLSRQVR